VLKKRRLTTVCEIEAYFLPAMNKYYEKMQAFRTHIPVDLSLQLKDTQVFPSKQIKAFLKELKELEEWERELNGRIKQFFRKHKGSVKALFTAVESFKKGKISTSEKVGLHVKERIGEQIEDAKPRNALGAICLCFTIIGYAGVFITLGYGIASTLGKPSIWRTIFSVTKETQSLKILGNFFFSSGTSTVSIIVTEGISLLQDA